MSSGLEEKALRNRAKERLTAGEPICGFGITMASPALAQILCASGADFLTVDLEHGAIDAVGAHAIIAATACSRCTPIVRVQSTEAWAVKPVLDAGALGIVFPMVRSREEVEVGLQSALYSPMGKRGIAHHFAPARWGVSGEEYLRQANDALLKIVLIETADAVADIRRIASVPGLDVATIAPGDLAAGLGYPGHTRHSEVQGAIAKIENAVLASEVALGGVALTADDAREKIQRGYRFLVLGFDVGLMQAAAAGLVDAVHK